MKKILLIEDDLTFSSILTIGLKSKGYAVENAYDGIDGIKKAEEFKPDMIILDINMPKLSGFDVTKKLKESAQFQKTPFIVLTALSQNSNMQRGYSLGIEDYLIKPFSIEHLFIKIKKYLS